MQLHFFVYTPQRAEGLERKAEARKDESARGLGPWAGRMQKRIFKGFEPDALDAAGAAAYVDRFAEEVVRGTRPPGVSEEQIDMVRRRRLPPPPPGRARARA